MTPRVLQLIIMGIPTGLIITGVISFFFYLNDDETGPPDADQIQKMMREDVSAEALNSYAKTLTETIGPRNTSNHKGIRAAAAYIESSLGRMNMGYHVERIENVYEGKDHPILAVEVPGTLRRGEFVILSAQYHSENLDHDPHRATTIAALLSIAHHFTGTENERSLRIVCSAPVENLADPTDQPLQRYAHRCATDDLDIVAALSIDLIGGSASEPVLEVSGSAPTEFLIESLKAGGAGETLFIPIPRPTPFDVAGYPAFVITDPSPPNSDRLFQTTQALVAATRALLNPSRPH